MEAVDVRQRTELLSAGDSEISAALELLEARLREWLAALREGQRLIDAAALWEEAQAQAEAQQAAALAEAAAEAETPDASAEPADVAGELSDETEASAAEAAEPGPAIPKVTSEADLAPDEGPPAAPAAPPVEADEDEALLATLDPELAAAIRVKRRLGHKKSVRELLAELEKQSAKSKRGRRGKDAKKWWR